MLNKNLELGILILFVIVVGGAAIYYVAVKKPDEAIVYITALQVFVSLLLVGVMWRQANIAKEQAKTAGRQINIAVRQANIAEKQAYIVERQTKLLEIDKKPAIDIRIGRHGYNKGLYCEISNLSKYPIRILEILVDGERKQPDLDLYSYLMENKPMRLGRNVIPAGGSARFDIRKIPDEVKIRVANLYESDLTSEIRYTSATGNLELI